MEKAWWLLGDYLSFFVFCFNTFKRRHLRWRFFCESSIVDVRLGSKYGSAFEVFCKHQIAFKRKCVKITDPIKTCEVAQPCACYVKTSGMRISIMCFNILTLYPWEKWIYMISQSLNKLSHFVWLAECLTIIDTHGWPQSLILSKGQDY